MGTVKKSIEELIAVKEKQLQRLQNELRAFEDREEALKKEKGKKLEAIRACEMDRNILLSQKLSASLSEKNIPLTSEVIDQLVSTLGASKKGTTEMPSLKAEPKKVLPPDDDKEFHIVRK